MNSKSSRRLNQQHPTHASDECASAIATVLRETTGKPAGMSQLQIRTVLSNDYEKTVVNSTLYNNKDKFVSDGGTPPLWQLTPAYLKILLGDRTSPISRETKPKNADKIFVFI